MSRGSFNINPNSSSSESWPRLPRYAFALGLFQANIASAELMAASARISPRDILSLKNSRSTTAMPACERASLAFRQVLHFE